MKAELQSGSAKFWHFLVKARREDHVPHARAHRGLGLLFRHGLRRCGVMVIVVLVFCFGMVFVAVCHGHRGLGLLFRHGLCRCGRHGRALRKGRFP